MVSEIKVIAKVLRLKPDPFRTLFAVNNQVEKSVEHSLFKGLRSVNPGCYLEFRSNAVRSTVCCCDVLDDIDPLRYQELNGKSSDEVDATFENLFVESVDSMLVSDVPVGAFVSGGVDSSLISAIAAKRNPDIKLFTANIVGKYSEFSHVEILSKQTGCEVFEEILSLK